MNLRIGTGYDIHRLVENRPLFLCGIQIPYDKGLLGHSDADAPVHAVIDAMLGALALGDIGHHFPDNDPAWKGASGEKLINLTLSLPEFQDWRISNLDMNIIAQMPKLAPYISAMRTRLADLLKIPVDAVSVKAKTAEKMGPVGTGEAIEAHVVVLMEKING